MLAVINTEFTEEEKKILVNYVTSAEGNVFAWKLGEKLDGQDAGALLSRYSRSSMTSREIFLKEFLPNRGRGRQFFEAWLKDYGDDSIQEMAGGIPVSTEYISNVAAKELEESRLASYIEKSSRYVQFDRKIPGYGYPFYKGHEIIGSRFGTEYVELMDSLFDSYSRGIPLIANHIKKENPFERQKFQIGKEVMSGSEAVKNAGSFGLSEEDMRKAYDRSIKAAALDLMRDYLPMSTLTHVGISANPRSYEHMTMKLISSNLKESNELGRSINSELKKIVPSLMRGEEDKHFSDSLEYMRKCAYESRAAVSKAIAAIADKKYKSTDCSVSLVRYTGDAACNPDRIAVDVIVGHVIYINSIEKQGISLKDSINIASLHINEQDRINILQSYAGERQNRRQKPGRAFENVHYEFDLKGTIGSYRDLQRHRIGTQERKLFSTGHGFILREQYKDAGIADDYVQKMERAADLSQRMSVGLSPEHSQYAVTFGHNARWYMNMDAREFFHMAELRTIPAGHPDYRGMVQEMHSLIRKQHPSVANLMKFVNMEKIELGRLSSEIRIAAKSNKLTR